MTNDDELLKKLERGIDRAEKIKIAGLEHDRRCLLAASRIRELTAELAFYRGLRDGVCSTGTHVIVAVSDLEKWQDSHCKAYCDHEPDEGCKPICSHECTEMRAMLKAAKEGD